ncbi:MAG: hypothetical protein Kow0098_02130 [Ignavibacteriaceae bacterium]
MNLQFQAGYIIESVKEFLLDNFPTQKEVVNRLYYLLSNFNVQSSVDLSENVEEPNPTLAVINNLISRGLPTRLNLEIERKISTYFNCFQEYTEYGAIKRKFIPGDSKTSMLLYRALHIIDPRLSKDNLLNNYEKSWERLDSRYEEDFLFEKLPFELGDNYDFIVQLIEKQRSLSELLKLNTIPNEYKGNFLNQRVDFSIEFPSELNNNECKGIIFEIDGEQHNDETQKRLDKERDNKSIECGWQPIRIKTSEWLSLKEKLQKVKELINTDYYNTLKSNYLEPLYETENGLKALQLILTPIAIARIQKVLIELLLRDILNLNDPLWKIAIIERDVPCGVLAIEDLLYMLNNIIQLQNKNITLPEINLQIYTSEEFFFSDINEQSANENKLLSEINEDNDYYDLILDISVLEREGLSEKYRFNKPSKNYFVIRSCHSIRSNRKIYTSERIRYSEICKKIPNESYEEIKNNKIILTNLLRDVFRKKEFRVGQLPILNRSLQLLSVVGLLQTGGGKSLTYQLAALLQPGITIIIDPIKSLMKDQVDGLKRNYIDNCLFINSSMNYEERKIALQRVHNGEALFLFVSPERLQIKEFRNELQELHTQKLFFSYCVIDEAHCVSEWGHDFRTSYLRLGENAIKYCLTKDLQPITLIGLTATASFDVLSDILREISTKKQLLDSDAIIRYETTNRPEIQYEIELIEIQSDSNNEFEIKKKLGQEKQRRLNELLQGIPQRLQYYNNSAEEIFNSAYKDDPQRVIMNGEFKEEEERVRIQISENSLVNFLNDNCTNAGLIFCPHRSWYFGVTDKYNENSSNNGVYDNLSDLYKSKTGTFMGTSNEDEKDNDIIDRDNIDNQNKFISNQLNLLVCTKAFGMGIDKPNIRFSIHINYPQSIESFIQESGRIGRDGKMALAYILFNEQVFNDNGRQIEVDTNILENFHSNSFRGVEKEKVIIWELLDSITYPGTTNIDRINEYLEEEGYDAYCNLWHWYLFIQKSFNEKYGCLKINDTLELDTSHSNLDYNLSREILLAVNQFILNNKPNNMNVRSWLQQKYNTQPQPGINNILNGEEEFDITLNFNNDWESVYDMIRNYLNRYGININLQKIRNSHLFSRNGRKSRAIQFDIFYERLNVDLNQNQITRLKSFFYRLRDKQDTEKAIYRLSIIGIIDEYEVNYRTHTYTIKGKRKSDEQIRQSLKQYLLKYYSENKVNEEFNIIDNIDLDNYLYRVLRYLINFIYAEIGKKRRQAINDMKFACQYRLQTSNVEFKDYIYYYFNSKYARQNYEEEGFNKSLYDRILIDGRDDIELVREFVGYMESQINNFRHLRGACIKLLQLRPESFSINLLKAFSILSIEQKNPVLLEDGIQSMLTGFTIYLETLRPYGKEYFSVVNEFLDELHKSTNGNIDEKLIQAIELIKLKYHSNWLNKFNNKFLVNYERANS